MRRALILAIPSLLGAAAGGALGYLTFRWVLKQGFHAPMLPGALLGLGCYGLSRHPSRGRGVACALAAVVLGLVSEWSVFPFAADASLAYFLAHAHHLRPVTLVMIAAGAFAAFLVGKDHHLPASQAPGPDMR
ncbi:MAG TPA: hypothetical protein VF590_27950 [Isosphaeraceae bacterium]|jgi:hypothetical protein